MSVILSVTDRNFVDFEKNVKDVLLSSYRFVDKVFADQAYEALDTVIVRPAEPHRGEDGAFSPIELEVFREDLRQYCSHIEVYQ